MFATGVRIGEELTLMWFRSGPGPVRHSSSGIGARQAPTTDREAPALLV